MHDPARWITERSAAPPVLRRVVGLHSDTQPWRAGLTSAAPPVLGGGGGLPSDPQPLRAGLACAAPPALGKLWERSGTQRSRAGLTCAAPPALRTSGVGLGFGERYKIHGAGGAACLTPTRR